MNAVEVEPDARLARVGGGALLGDLDRASLAHGLATTAGNVSHTGVGGLTLGGGMGWLARKLGMACDNVASYRVVTADGTVLTASADENADLFWGLRGGGGNFGVVTRFEFRLHPIVDRVLSVDLYLPTEEASGPMRAFVDWAADAPRSATPVAWTGVAGEWPFVPESLHGRPMTAIGFIWVGDPQAGRALLPSVRALAGAKSRVYEVEEELSYAELQSGSDEAMGHGMRRYWKSHYLSSVPDAAIEAFLGRGDPPADGVQPNGFVQAYGGAIAEVDADASAFSHRDTTLEFVVMAGWEDPAEDEARMAGPRRYAAAVAPYASGVYVNGLADEGEAGTRRAYRPEALARLTALKDLYDPDNAFHLNHNIRPSRG
jgi:FAD/FMN-containing dehydrogenase